MPLLFQKVIVKFRVIIKNWLAARVNDENSELFNQIIRTAGKNNTFSVLCSDNNTFSLVR